MTKNTQHLTPAEHYRQAEALISAADTMLDEAMSYAPTNPIRVDGLARLNITLLAANAHAALASAPDPAPPNVIAASPRITARTPISADPEY